jgi:hypothetical protein
MHFLIPALLTASLSLSSALSLPAPRLISERKLPTSAIVHQFPNPTWVENIAVRSNGQLLVTTIGIPGSTGPNLYLIDPLSSLQNPSSPSTATLVHSFAPFHGVLGITEVEPDHFYVVTGNLSLSPFAFGTGTYAVQSVDLSSYSASTNTGAVIKELTAIPQAGVLNGATTLDESKGLIIIADSEVGAIWQVDVNTGAYSILLQEPEMAVGTAPPPLGINGVKVLKTAKDSVYIYFDNTSQGLFCRVPLSLSTLQKTGPVEILETGFSVDDFALDLIEGVAYLAGGDTNSIGKIGLGGGVVTTVLGGQNETIVEGPTSVAVGRGPETELVKFVTTNGGFLSPIDGTIWEGGRVVALFA